MSSTELLDAASISTTSSEVASAIERHDSHAPHGVTVGPPFTQFSEAARILAIDVLPVPARADEQVRVVDAVLLDRVAQRADDVLLADDVCERARAMTAVQRSGGRGHGRPSLEAAGGVKRTVHPPSRAVPGRIAAASSGRAIPSRLQVTA